MTRLATLAVLLVVSSPTLFLARTPEAAAPAQAAVPVGHYCNMGFFTPEGVKRFDVLVQKIVAAVTESEELENGFLFRFSGQFREAGEWIDGARGCCPTIEYSVAFAPQSGPVTLRITGGAGAKEFIREEFRKIIHEKE